MSVNIKQLDGTLKKVAGSTILLDATCSEIREGTWINTEVDTATGDTRIEANVTFDVPMPDTDYMVVFDKPVTGHGESYNYVNVSTKSTTGFTFYVTYTGNLTHTPLGLQVHWYAVRLVKLDGYTELQNKVNNPDSTPTENSTNLVTSGGVYDAIKNASSVFIGTSSEWESETSKTDYQVAILTDKPNVNAVDSTDGSTTVVGEPNKRWVGTQAEWNNLTAAEKAKYEIICFNDDNGESGKDIYSTTETKTNKVWIDGKPIYRKVFTNIPLPEESDISQTAGVTAIATTIIFPAHYIDNIVNASFVVINTTYNHQFSLPRRWNGIDTSTEQPLVIGIDANVGTNDVTLETTIETRSNRIAWNNTSHKVRAIVEYTKVGD